MMMMKNTREQNPTTMEHMLNAMYLAVRFPLGESKPIRVLVSF